MVVVVALVGTSRSLERSLTGWIDASFWIPFNDLQQHSRRLGQLGTAAVVWWWCARLNNPTVGPWQLPCLPVRITWITYIYICI